MRAEFQIASSGGAVADKRRLVSQAGRCAIVPRIVLARGEIEPTSSRNVLQHGRTATEEALIRCGINRPTRFVGSRRIRHAANIIERYAALVPEVADEVLAKMMAARAKARREEEAKA